MMRKFSTIFLSGLAVVTLLSLASTARAQFPQSTVNQLEAKARREGPCRDPWITIAIWDWFASTHTIQGVGDRGECEPALYNGGSWGSYAELYRGVKTAFNNMSGYVTITKILNRDGTVKIVTNVTGFPPRTQVVSNDGGTLISQDGANIKIILNGGGNIVSQGGGNYKTMSTSTEKRINLGKSVLVATKN